MRVLDMGCGSGDVSFLVAELVGPGGRVVGADRAAAPVQWATARASSRQLANVSFVEGDPAEMEFGEPFDAVVGRLVLMYCPEPVATIRKLVRHLRPGGLVVFQEFDLANCRSWPPAPVFDRAVGWIRRTFQATGARMEQGLELYPVYVEAGLPGPWMRIDGLVGGGPDCPAYELVAEVIQTLLPVMEKLKIATATEVEITSLAERIRQDVVAQKGVVLSPALIGAWSHKPA